MERPPEPTSGSEDDRRLEELIVEFFRRSDEGDEGALKTLCEENPLQAPGLRARIATLGELGLLDDNDIAAIPLPQHFGNYKILRQLGAGGMGIVYLAEDTGAGRQVALKVVRGLNSDVATERFRREARALARLDHPGIVRVLGSGSVDNALFMAMEPVPGEGLDERLKRRVGAGELALISEAVRQVRDVARALHAVHAAGLVHRDVKPSNIRITPDDRAVLVDFGLARDLEDGSFSRTGAFLGTPHYAAPEQVAARREEIAPATDVYGLGVTLYECLTHRVPYSAATTEAVFHQILTGDAVSPRRRNPQVSRDLETVVMKAMEKDPARRYATADALANDLDAVIGLRAITARPPGPARRLARTLLRHRIASTMVATALVVLLGLWVLGEIDQARLEHRREGDAKLALLSARSQLDNYLAQKAATADLEEGVDHLRLMLRRRYLEPEEDTRLDHGEASVELLETERELAFADVREELRRAEQLGADPGQVAELRAELDLLKLVEAVLADQAEVADFYRTRIESLGQTAAGRAADQTRGELVVKTPRGPTDLHLFRYALHSQWVAGGEPRMVPSATSFAGAPEAPKGTLSPGTWALELTADAAPLQRGDLIVELGGHPIEGSVLVARGAGQIERLDRLTAIGGLAVHTIPDARWLANVAAEPNDREFHFSRGDFVFSVRGTSLEALGISLGSPAELARQGCPAVVHTPTGVIKGDLPELRGLRLTANPVLIGEDTFAGRSSEHSLELDPGVYLAVLEGRGFTSVRFAVHIPPGAATLLSVAMPRAGEVPPGFAPVFDGVGRVFFMMEHEVTCGEYLAFINHSEVVPRIEAAGGSALVPRTAVTDGWRPVWDKDERGLWHLPSGVSSSHPVTQVSWDDATAYAAWMTRRLKDQGRPLTATLPGHSDWHAAANPVGQEWRHVFGPHFRAKWTHSNFAHRRPALAEVMTHPIDASPSDVYDLAGSVMEWSAGWYWEEKSWRTFRCGAWSYADPQRFETQFAQGDLPKLTTVSLGFRLVVRPDE